MTLEFINPPELGPAAGFSHAASAIGTRRIHLAGQTALNAEGRIIDGDIVDQFDQALGNLMAALRAAGGQPHEIASMTIYLVDIDEYKARGREIGQVWKKHLGRHYPALAAVGVTRLWDIEALVEVQGCAEVAVEITAEA